MRRPTLHILPSALVASVVLASVTTAHAMNRGDRCTLRAPLPIRLKTSGGMVDATLDKGTVVQLNSGSDSGHVLVTADDVRGSVAAADLESACRGTMAQCTLETPLVVYEEEREDSRSSSVRAKSLVNVVKRGPTWTAVHTNDTTGFVLTAELTPACVTGPSVTSDDDDPTTTDAEGKIEDITEEIVRGDGPGVLFLPFHAERGASLRDAEVIGDALWSRLSYYRPDAGRGSDAGRDRALSINQQVAEAARRAKNAEMAYALIGRIDLSARGPVGASVPVAEKPTVRLALIDPASGKVMKGIKAHPAHTTDAAWVEQALATLLPLLAPAPDAKMPKPSHGSNVR